MAGGKGKSSGGKSSGGKTSAADGPKKQQSHSARAGLQVCRVIQEMHFFFFICCVFRITIPRFPDHRKPHPLRVFVAHRRSHLHPQLSTHDLIPINIRCTRNLSHYCASIAIHLCSCERVLGISPRMRLGSWIRLRQQRAQELGSPVFTQNGLSCGR